MCAHTHDDIDWAARLAVLRRGDQLDAPSLATVARRLADTLPLADRSTPLTVVDVGSGSGGMSVQLVHALAERVELTVVLVDAVPALLEAAEEAVRRAGPATVRVVEADVAAPGWADDIPPADLLWAAAVVHHLPDQQSGVDGLVTALRPGGLLALSEGGLGMRCLPWDLGFGRPGLEGRLEHARAEWFIALRAGMPGVVPMPYGWGTALTRAALSDVTSFSYLLDHPAPPEPSVRATVLDRITWLAETTADRLDDTDRAALDRLLDTAAPDGLTHRDDLHLLAAYTVHCGYKR